MASAESQTFATLVAMGVARRAGDSLQPLVSSALPTHTATRTICVLPLPSLWDISDSRLHKKYFLRSCSAWRQRNCSSPSPDYESEDSQHVNQSIAVRFRDQGKGRQNSAETLQCFAAVELLDTTFRGIVGDRLHGIIFQTWIQNKCLLPRLGQTIEWVGASIRYPLQCAERYSLHAARYVQLLIKLVYFRKLVVLMQTPCITNFIKRNACCNGWNFRTGWLYSSLGFVSQIERHGDVG